MFQFMSKEINTVLGEQTILIWTYEIKIPSNNTYNGNGLDQFIRILSVLKKRIDPGSALQGLIQD